MEKKMIYIILQKNFKKFGLPTKLKIGQKNRSKIHEGIYKGVFLDKKNKNNNPRYISLKKKLAILR